MKVMRKENAELGLLLEADPETFECLRRAVMAAVAWDLGLPQKDDVTPEDKRQLTASIVVAASMVGLRYTPEGFNAG